ncbi:acylphosphatase [Roseivirga sp. BDSF3-8]|uniref:acylphosphatase n=1 Tax=Roseivirga sp. BDSF3-8 TaxID=3241598 RepID=UPI00353222C7
MTEGKHLSIYITGRVQGVFYRKSTLEKARELGIKGWVKNLENGSVQIEAEGDHDKLESLVEWAKQGPDNAEVLQVKANESEWEGYENFEIRH